ncbi:hypothetical protein DPMN_127762 [Dreissena polymorpha]|uniref:Uncharacterized protein n=1 Tax=Dreissena polymorpha TaxID=45954 RepID=A0A9D4GYB5_DREPO|nr:hypothetical protein DPMN_127762 [Dreissena polymorpha]
MFFPTKPAHVCTGLRHLCVSFAQLVPYQLQCNICHELNQSGSCIKHALPKQPLFSPINCLAAVQEIQGEYFRLIRIPVKLACFHSDRESH